MAIKKATAPALQLKDYNSNTYMDGEMEVRFAVGPEETKGFDTQQLIDNFLVKDLMVADKLKLVYTHYDRVIVGGAVPVAKTLTLPNHPELRAEYFLERREIGIINVGGKGTVSVDGEIFELSKKEALYVGSGSKEVIFSSLEENPALFYELSSNFLKAD